MGTLYRRKKDNGERALIWRMKYRAWDSRAKAWGNYKFESSGTTVKQEAKRILEERELEEERKSLGLVVGREDKTLRDALVEFLEQTKAYDREFPERNLKVM